MSDHGFRTAAWEAVAALARLLEMAQPPAGEDADRLREQARRALAAMRAAHPSR